MLFFSIGFYEVFMARNGFMITKVAQTFAMTPSICLSKFNKTNTMIHKPKVFLRMSFLPTFRSVPDPQGDARVEPPASGHDWTSSSRTSVVKGASDFGNVVFGTTTPT